MANPKLLRRGPALVALLTLALVMTSAGRAVADELRTYEVAGEADAGAGDPRAVAVDDAFATATREAVEDLLSKAQRTEHRALLGKEIYGRARRWVASYKVLDDTTSEGKRKLTVSVRIHQEALRARLVELAILQDPAPSEGEPPEDGGAVAPSGAGSVPVPGSSSGSRWAGQSATLLLRVRRGERVAASYGASGERELVGADAVNATLTGRGLVLRPAPFSGPAARAEGELPMSDEAARALAKDAKAELAVLVAAEVSGRQSVRGVASPMILARAKARVVAASRERPEGEGVGAVVVPAGEDERAIAAAALARATTTAVAEALPVSTAVAPSATLTSDDEPLPAVEGAVWLRLAARTPWRVVTAVLRHLGKQPSTKAELRRFSPAGYLVLVTSGNGLERIAALTRSTALPSGAGALKVRSERGAVAVRVESP